MKSLRKKSIKKLIKVLKPIRFSHIKKQINCDFQWYGNRYGGFNINPNMIQGNGIVYSFGIGEDISFDKAMIKHHDCRVFGFDPTPKSIAWCAHQILPDNFHFYPFGIANSSGMATFNLPVNSDHVSGSLIAHDNVNRKNQVKVEMKSFEDIQEILDHKKIDVLKMDIEGSEYDVIRGILECSVQITQIVVEFHERFFKNGRTRSKNFIKLMNQRGYKIFAFSKSYEEVSFIQEKAL